MCPTTVHIYVVVRIQHVRMFQICIDFTGTCSPNRNVHMHTDMHQNILSCMRMSFSANDSIDFNARQSLVHNMADLSHGSNVPYYSIPYH